MLAAGSLTAPKGVKSDRLPSITATSGASPAGGGITTSVAALAFGGALCAATGAVLYSWWTSKSSEKVVSGTPVSAQADKGEGASRLVPRVTVRSPVPSDIAVSQSVEHYRIDEIASAAGILPEELVPFG